MISGRRPGEPTATVPSKSDARDLKIELIGHAGSGKTTAARLAAAELGLPYHVVDSRLREGYAPASKLAVRLGQLGQVRTHHRLFALGMLGQAELLYQGLVGSAGQVLPALLGYVGPGVRRFSHSAAEAARLSVVVDASGPGLFDEGPRHKLCYSLAEHPDIDIERWVPRIAHRLPGVSCVVWVHCDADVAWTRYVARLGRGHDDGRGPVRTRDVFDRYGAVARHLTRRIPTLHVESTDSDPVEVAEQIVNGLLEMIASGSLRPGASDVQARG